MARRHGMSGTTEYKIWAGMKQRCSNPNLRSYRFYGARGIAVCQRWAESFAAFYADMGPRPDMSLTLDRKDSNGNYEPSNCRWATNTEQILGRRDQQPGTRAPKLSAQLIAPIYALCAMGHSVGSVSRLFGVEDSSVRGIWYGWHWNHIERAAVPQSLLISLSRQIIDQAASRIARSTFAKEEERWILHDVRQRRAA